ncbi:hypothetical protein KIL84_016647 [Mauremys mutica]|uniref:Uncharacterized protein n=1 Tax=Mauremys mutica TaxID=74926 RepID=A0A9D3X4M8_9SAUR|nr:hypothetical protein KIL84_016647 [Mauremys mutica]
MPSNGTVACSPLPLQKLPVLTVFWPRPVSFYLTCPAWKYLRAEGFPCELHAVHSEGNGNASFNLGSSRIGSCVYKGPCRNASLGTVFVMVVVPFGPSCLQRRAWSASASFSWPLCSGKAGISQLLSPGGQENQNGRAFYTPVS